MRGRSGLRRASRRAGAALSDVTRLSPRASMCVAVGSRRVVGRGSEQWRSGAEQTGAGVRDRAGDAWPRAASHVCERNVIVRAF